METVSAEEALKLLVKPVAVGRKSYGKELVDAFIATGALFGRERYSNEADRKAKMLSVKKYLKDANLENDVWVVADGASILFTNMKVANKAEASQKKAVTDAFNAYRARYANVGKKKS